MASDIFFSLDSVVTASSEDIYSVPVQPTGTHIVVMEFGGCIPFMKDGSYIAIQWGQAGSWKTIRAIAREGNYSINKEFIADGVKTFRVIRKNTDTNNRPMLVWVTGYAR